MSSSGTLLLRQRHLRTGRAALHLRPITLAHLGVRSAQRPTQRSICSSSWIQQASSVSHTRRRRGRPLVVHAVAMVNVDFASPSLLLGTMLIGCGVLLLNLRNFQNKVSRDADIVVAAMVSIVGSTLIFQGWRLDPLLLLCQALTTSVAFWYGLETFRLRSKEADLPPPQLPPGSGPDAGLMDPLQQAAAPDQQQYYQTTAGFPPGGPGVPFLPPGSEGYYPWGNSADSVASTSGRATGPYGDTIQYDYYGNPITAQQEPVYSSAGYKAFNDGAYGPSAEDPDYFGAGNCAGTGYGGGNSGFGTAGYDTGGLSIRPGLSFSGPYSVAGAPSPPPGRTPMPSILDQDQQQQQQPTFASSSGSGSSGSGSQGASGISPVGPSVGGAFESFFDSSAASSAADMSTSPWSTSPWNTNLGPARGPSPGAGLGGSASSGSSGGSSGDSGRRDSGRGKGAGRLDVFEQVDDWE